MKKTTENRIVINNIINNYIDSRKLTAFNVSVTQKLESSDDLEANEVYAAEVEKLLTFVREASTGDIYIYNLKGYYEKCEKWMLQALLKYIINQSGFLWKLRDEGEICAAIQRDITMTVDCFNAVNAVNFRNGVFFFDSGQFQEGVASKYYFSYILDYDYNENAECSTFMNFIKQTARNDDELIAVIQEMMGYCLSTETKAEKAFFLKGNGSNGKSVLAGVMSKLCGESLTCSISLEGINGHFGMSDMIGKRLNICAENESFPSSEKFKSIISGDKMNIPVKYKNDWTGRLMIKNVFLMNSLPLTPDVTYGFFRKIIIIPFNHTVKPDEINVNLSKELEAELSGIFNWAYEGYKRLVSNNYNFTYSKAIDGCMKEYAERENHTGIFFNNTYEFSEGEKIRKSDIYRNYQEWSVNNGYTTLTKNKFYSALAIKAEEDKSIKLNYIRIRGINYLKDYTYRINADEEDNPIEKLFHHTDELDLSDLDNFVFDEN